MMHQISLVHYELDNIIRQGVLALPLDFSIKNKEKKVGIICGNSNPYQNNQTTKSGDSYYV